MWIALEVIPELRMYAKGSQLATFAEFVTESPKISNGQKTLVGGVVTSNCMGREGLHGVRGWAGMARVDERLSAPISLITPEKTDNSEVRA